MPNVSEQDESEDSSQSDSGGEAEESGLSPKDMALFAVRAARANIWFCIAVALGVGGLGFTGVSAMPVVYDATCKIFMQEGGAVTSSLASGREHYRPSATESTRGLQELLLARDNLTSIVREAKLFDKWPNTRPWPMRLKDRLSLALLGPPSRKDMERGFVEMLSTSITGVEDGESVRIHGQWRDKVSAYDVTRLVLRNFLAARAASDLGPIQRAIPFLESQLQQADEAIESAVTRVLTAKGHIPTAAAAAALPAPTAAAPEEPEAPEAAAKNSQNESALLQLGVLSKQLSDARRQQRALVEPWRRRITELKSQLVELSASYSADHPLVRQQEARIAAASEVPPELEALRAKEAELLSTLSSRSASTRSGGTTAPGSSRGNTAAAAAAAAEIRDNPDDPELAPLKARLVAALRKSDDIAERLESARIELATAEADFNHRYVVIEQPEVPNKPFKSKKPALFAAVAVAALLIGFLAGVARQIMKGRMTEVWQVRSLGLELLAEVELKKLPPAKKS